MSRWKAPYGVKTSQTTYDATTFTCQKCLEKGHFTYQCTGKRKYVSRVSQTSLLHKRMEVEANSTPSVIKHVDAGNGLESQTTLLHNKRMKVEAQATPITLKGVESQSSGKTSSGTSEDSESDSTSSDSDDSSSSSDTRDSESDSTSSSSSSSSSGDSSSSSSSDDD